MSDDYMTPAERHWRDSLRVYRDKENDTWYELPDHPDLFTLGVDRNHAEANGADGSMYAGWTLDQLRAQYEPLELVSGFAMPGDTVDVTTSDRVRRGKYVGLVSPGYGHWVDFKGGSVPPEQVSELAKIEVVERSALRRAFSRHATDPVFVQRDYTKPLPNDGDRVRVETPNGNTFEGIYHVAGGVTTVSDDDASLEITSHPQDVVFTVLERAKPAEPGDDVYAVATGTVVFVHMSTDYSPENRWLRVNCVTGQQLMSWAEVLDEVAKFDTDGLPLIELKRGEEIT